jgi:hypothetical protein
MNASTCKCVPFFYLETEKKRRGKGLPTVTRLIAIMQWDGRGYQFDLELPRPNPIQVNANTSVIGTEQIDRGQDKIDARNLSNL